MEYKRLTKKKLRDTDISIVLDEHNNVIVDRRLFEKFIKQHNRLAELEDKIEQGTLIELPCKVGDTVYVRENTWTWYNSSFNRAFIGGEFFVIGKITSIRITEKQTLIKVKATYKENPCKYTKRDYPISAIGKTVFLTREEAEIRLKELQE